MRAAVLQLGVHPCVHNQEIKFDYHMGAEILSTNGSYLIYAQVDIELFFICK